MLSPSNAFTIFSWAGKVIRRCERPLVQALNTENCFLLKFPPALSSATLSGTPQMSMICLTRPPKQLSSCSVAYDQSIDCSLEMYSVLSRNVWSVDTLHR
ncbi:hypothetical protein DNTS_006740 [Danionella cerebrum]|uniref:Uncharacterized protein n=1 Tax=Danionella cerebrum TaxID=2873325 RepID=A0A553QZ89_9TELE|nr:hypothetical protein DNTS_006740 [Danionella translucida]